MGDREEGRKSYICNVVDFFSKWRFSKMEHRSDLCEEGSGIKATHAKRGAGSAASFGDPIHTDQHPLVTIFLCNSMSSARVWHCRFSLGGAAQRRGQVVERGGGGGGGGAQLQEQCRGKRLLVTDLLAEGQGHAPRELRQGPPRPDHHRPQGCLVGLAMDCIVEEIGGGIERRCRPTVSALLG